MKELISIIVPVYNVEKYLNRCIDSLISQTYQNIEIILVDDGSTDSSSEIVDGYLKKDNRIKVFHKDNGGLSDARNKGIEISKGKYLSFVDSDDYVTNTYIETLYNTIIEYEADISICSYKVNYETGQILKKGKNKKGVYSTEKALKNMLYHRDFDVSAWAKLYKKELFNGIIFPKGRLFEDAATTYKLMMKSKRISYNLKEEYYYIIRDKSITTNSFNLQKMDLIVSTKEMFDEVSLNYPRLKKAAKRRLVYAYLSTLSQLVQSNDQSSKYEKQEQSIYNYIKKNGKSVLWDINAPIRDKVGILSLIFGINFYKEIWNSYKRMTGRS